MADAGVQTVFNLETGPLVRAQLIRVADEKYVFVFTMHHIISDGWSQHVVANEIFAMYRAFRRGQPNPLPPLRIQYKDYSAWHYDLLDGAGARQHREYWLEQLKAPLPVPELPADYPRPALKTYTGAGLRYSLDEALSQALLGLSEQYGTTLFMTLLAATKVLLYKYTGKGDIIVGSPISGRVHKDLENQVGFYANTLALRTVFSGKDNFINLLYAVKQNLLHAYEHQVYPFDALVEDLGLPRDQSRSPLFDVMVVLQNISLAPGGPQSLEDVRTSEYPLNTHASKYDLDVNFYEENKVIGVFLQYNRDLFTESRMLLLKERFTLLLTEITKNPRASLDAIIASLESHFTEPAARGLSLEINM
jgi:hypothetical protein